MLAPMTFAASQNAVAAALVDARRRLLSVAAISGAINLLMLSGSIYMLQVYDRVLPSRSLSTLFGLSVIVLAAYLLQGYLDAVRTRMLARIAGLFDAALQAPIYGALVDLPLKGVAPAAVQQPLRDLDLVRAFLSGMGPTAFLDMPWLPIFVIALFLFHPLIGLAAVFGAVLIVSTTLLAEHQSKSLAKAAADRGARRAALADAIRRNAEAIHALGMRRRFMSAWCRLNESHIAETTRMRDIEADIGAIAKVLRYVLQSAILGIGAALVVGRPGERWHHDCVFNHDGPGAGTHRNCPRHLEAARLRSRSRQETKGHILHDSFAIRSCCYPAFSGQASVGAETHSRSAGIQSFDRSQCVLWPDRGRGPGASRRKRFGQVFAGQGHRRNLAAHPG